MITTLVYRHNKLAARDPAPATLAALRDEPGAMFWINLADPTDDEVKLVLDRTFHFHPLVIEDCMDVTPYPKLEMQEECLYLVMHAVAPGGEKIFKTNDIDLFIGKNFLVTHHREPQRAIEQVRDHYLKSPWIQVRGPDRFAHAILDSMVDGYKPLLEKLRRQVENISQRALGHIAPAELFPAIASLRRQLSELRQILRPQRAVARELAHGKNKYIRPLMQPYLRDLSEELERIDAQAASLAEQAIQSFRIYLGKSNKDANAGIRVMTALTALTFPTLLIGSWYGMNFLDSMPELKTHYGYLSAALVMLLGTCGTWLFMRHKKWL